jgi:hypothetical protein
MAEEAREITGALDRLAEIEVFGIPLGDALVGGGVAALGDVVGGLVKGAWPDAPDWAVPMIGAYAVGIGPIRRTLGTRATQTAQLLLAWDAVQGIFDIRSKVAGLFGGLVGKASGGSLTTVTAGASQPQTLDEYLAKLGA